MDTINLIENLIAAIESGDKDYMDETVGLAKLIVKAGAPATPAAPAVLGGGFLVHDEDNEMLIGPFPDDPSAQAWGQANLVPTGVSWDVVELSDGSYAASAVPQQQNLPPGYISTNANPGARIANIPPGTLYRP